MKYIDATKIKVIQSETATEFEENFNASMAELSDKHPKYQLADVGTFVAYIIYEETTQIPEDIRDEYILRGEVFTCADCPYLNDTGDKRVKYFDCEHSESEITRKTNIACNWFFTKLAHGEISP